MRGDVVQSIAALGVLAEPDAVDAIDSAPDAALALARVLHHLKSADDPPMTLTLAEVELILSAPSAHSPAPAVARASAIRTAADIGSEVRVTKDSTGESTCEGHLEDFTRYFRDRLVRLRKV